MNDRPSLDWPAVQRRANEDAEFRQHARFWNATIRLVIGRKAYKLRMEGGAVALIEPWFGAIAADLSISASEEEWTALLAKTPAPFYQDLYPAVIHHGFEVAGSVNDYCAYYPAIRRLIELLRNVDEEAAPAPAAAPSRAETPRFDAAAGRYVHLDIAENDYRVYFETAGSGETTLLLQHTAGADGRQWRHVL